MKFDLKKLRPADGPRKKEKSYQPPGVGLRKMGVLLFWAAFGFMLLVVFVSVGDSAEGEEDPAAAEEEVNLATGTAGAEFAKAFAQEFFSWEATAEGWTERETKLQPLLAAGLDEQAGLLLADQEWNSTADNAQILAVQPAGDQKAIITVQIDQVLTNVDDAKKKERQQHTLAISVVHDQAFGVYALPSFVGSVPVTAAQAETLNGTSVEGETGQNIRNFLATFFQSYTTDTPDKLAYFLEDETAAGGLEGGLVFEEVQTVNAVEDGPGQYLVEASVLLRQPTTGSGFVSQYRMTVNEQDGRYIVTKLNKGDE